MTDGYRAIDLMTAEESTLLGKHFSAARKTTPDTFERSMAASFTEVERGVCSQLYKKLREADHYPVGYANNRIIWNTSKADQVKKKVDEYEPFDVPISSLTIPELQKRSRNLFRKMMS